MNTHHREPTFTRNREEPPSPRGSVIRKWRRVRGVTAYGGHVTITARGLHLDGLGVDARPSQPPLITGEQVEDGVARLESPPTSGGGGGAGRGRESPVQALTRS